jgi:general secretion pathway protein F/type IV pilus assembly protein PilC
MPDYQYTARQMSGQEVTGVLTATSEQEALGSLATRALFPIRIGLAPTEQVKQRRSQKRVRGSQLAMAYSQLADLLHAGVPLLRSLEILEQQSNRGALANVLQQVREEVADGTRLADAMRPHQRIFGELAISMVRAGEEGGFLEDVLKRIAQFTEHQEELKSRVFGALVYPLFLMGMGSLIVTGMLVFFVPKFAPIFDRMAERGELPLATKLLMGFSANLQVYGLWLASLIGLGVWWLVRFAATEKGRRLADTWRLKAAGLGPIVRSLAISRFCRILGTLLKNGVPILPALRISKDATGNQLLCDAIGLAADNISAGKALARPLSASGQFPVEVVEMIAVGEEANNLEQVLIDIAENLERRTYRQLDLFVRLLEPVMLLVMAVVILFLVIALLLPVFQSANAL